MLGEHLLGASVWLDGGTAHHCNPLSSLPSGSSATGLHGRAPFPGLAMLVAAVLKGDLALYGPRLGLWLLILVSAKQS